jgi:hypothetical protein
MDQVWPRNQHVGCLRLSGMHVRFSSHCGPAGYVQMRRCENVDHVITGTGQLRLRKKREQRIAQRQMRPVLFNNAEGQDAHALRLMNRLGEIRPGEFFPI